MPSQCHEAEFCLSRGGTEENVHSLLSRSVNISGERGHNKWKVGELYLVFFLTQRPPSLVGINVTVRTTNAFKFSLNPNVQFTSEGFGIHVELTNSALSFFYIFTNN